MASTSFIAGRSNTVAPVDNKRDIPRRESYPVCGDNGSVRQQHCQIIKLTTLTVIPGLILFCRCIADLVANTEAVVSNNYVMEQIAISVSIGDIIHSCQEERGTTALYVASDADPFVRSLLIERYHNTDLKINSLSKWMPTNDPTHFRSRGSFHDEIRAFRANLVPENTTLFDVIRFYSDNNQVFINLIGETLIPDHSVSYWKDLVAYKLLTLSKEQAGIERALGSTFFVSGQFPIEDLLWYKDKLTLGEHFLKQSMSYSSYSKQLMDVYFSGSRLASNLKSMREEICNNTMSVPSVIKGTIWFENMTDYIDILKNVHDALALRISQIASEENTTLKTLLWSSAIQVLIAAMVVPVVAILNRNIVRKIQAYGSELAVKTRELEDEKKRTEMLLLQLIPRSVAKKLIQNGQVIPEAFKSVTIMFSDISDFAELSGQCTPFEAIQILNDIYWMMDDQLDKRDVYRIDIAGAGYMVASGVPRRNGVKHVEEIARLSLDLIKAISERDICHIGEKIKMRIGFHTGPCAAGIVGNIMPRYCVFGDTVNIASRMESTGLPQRIQMSERCANILSTYKLFSIAERGLVEVKGKGEMKTYWLEGLVECSDV